MGVDVSLFVAIVLCILLLIMIAGFTCYMFKNYCHKRFHITDQRNSGSPQRDSLVSSLTKTTTDDPDRSTMKLHTIEQIIKREEKGSMSRSLKTIEIQPSTQLKQVDIPQSNTTKTPSLPPLSITPTAPTILAATTTKNINNRSVISPS